MSLVLAYLFVAVVMHDVWQYNQRQDPRQSSLPQLIDVIDDESLPGQSSLSSAAKVHPTTRNSRIIRSMRESNDLFSPEQFLFGAKVNVPPLGTVSDVVVRGVERHQQLESHSNSNSSSASSDGGGGGCSSGGNGCPSLNGEQSDEEKKKTKTKHLHLAEVSEVQELPPPSRGPPIISHDGISSCNSVSFSKGRAISPSDYIDLGSVPSFFTRLTRFAQDKTNHSGRTPQNRVGVLSPRHGHEAGQRGRTKSRSWTRLLAEKLASSPDSDGNNSTEGSVNIISGGTPKNVFFFHMYEQVQSHRRLCSIESFLRKNPDYTVYIYAPSLKFFRSTWSERRNPRVRLVKLNYDDIFKGTPFQTWYSSGAYLKSRWVKMNLGNACRLAVLWKKGGTYLDLDVISLSPQPSGLHKAVASEHISSINCAYLRYPARDGFLWESMKDFVKNWNGMKWGIQGPQLTSRVYFRCCQDVLATLSWLNTPEAGGVSKKARKTFMDRMYSLPPHRLSPSYEAPAFCKDFVVLEEVSVYPIHFKRHNALLYNWKDQCDTVTKMANRSFLFHYWDHFFPDTIRFGNESLMAKVMAETCPNTFSRYE
ncbi:hypothetical protein CBR_g46741 [Chara braunii]|uniref:Alpha 1,4-glycosyltransferase domain-containing protein n=1 Tax=Chara braunii TaxID=69332 RepID=A0A388K419_CHABU|nr:hypothetical protein CBR_g46741 [Chara braunii]|eukprot:GBG64785.1 hypothetical protein CBR_g46741 [Chara braunii]